MSTRFVKRISTVIALSGLPLLQGCVGGWEDEIVLRNAWMPIVSLSTSSSSDSSGSSGSTTSTSVSASTGSAASR